MLGDITVSDNIYIVCGTTDMRKSIDGLCSIVREAVHGFRSIFPVSFLWEAL